MEPKDRQTQHRAYVLDHVVAGSLTLDEAARVLELSTRQVRRLIVRHADGPAGLVHGNRGRVPANRIDDGLRRRVVELATTTYAGVNHAHLAELLAEREGLEIAERTLRRILAASSVPPTRTRRPPRHRSRRERMPREGQLLQVDGSRHRWFGPDLPFATLVAGIDDATSRVPGGTFRAQEDAVGYFTTFAQTAERHGLPGAVYSDRHGIFSADRNRAPTLAEQLAGKPPGAARRQPVGQRGGPVPPGPAGTGGYRTASGPKAHPAVRARPAGPTRRAPCRRPLPRPGATRRGRAPTAP